MILSNIRGGAGAWSNGVGLGGGKRKRLQIIRLLPKNPTGFVPAQVQILSAALQIQVAFLS